MIGDETGRISGGIGDLLRSGPVARSLDCRREGLRGVYALGVGVFWTTLERGSGDGGRSWSFENSNSWGTSTGRFRIGRGGCILRSPRWTTHARSHGQVHKW